MTTKFYHLAIGRILEFGIKKKNKIFKIAAIGIRVKNWIAYHGFSLNINNDLDSYKKIIKDLKIRERKG